MARHFGSRLRAGVVESLEPRSLLSDVIAVGPEFRVNTYTTGDQYYAGVAMDADGDFVVAWRSYGQDGSGSGIYAQRYNAAGASQGAEFRVNTYTTGTQMSPSVAMDAKGNFVVAWDSNGQDGSGRGIYAQRYDLEGNAQGGEFRVNSYTTSSQSRPSVAMSAAGDFIVAWYSEGQDGGGGDFPRGVYAQRYDVAGIPQGGEFQVNTYTTNTQADPSVDMDAAGNFVIVWHSEPGQDGSGAGIFAQRYDSLGIAQGGEFRVNTSTTNSQFSPAVAMDATGDFMVAWTSYQNGPGQTDVYAQRYDAGGVPQGAEFRVNTYIPFNQVCYSVAMDATGDFVVAWGSAVQDSSSTGAYAQRYNASGIPQGGEFRVNTYTTGIQWRPSVAMDADGDFVVTWESGATVGTSEVGQDGSGYGVYAQRYAVVAEVTASSYHFATAPHKLSFTFDRDVSGSLGTNDLVVQNLTTMQTIPSTDFSLSYDALTNVATFTYTGTTAGIAGMLPDGNYSATLIASGITTIQGAPLAIDYVLNFQFLQADADHDGRVNLEDFNILAANFGQSPRNFTQGDFNYDTIVNLDDFNILASRFGQVLAAPASVLVRTGAVADMSIEEEDASEC